MYLLLIFGKVKKIFVYTAALRKNWRLFLQKNNNSVYFLIRLLQKNSPQNQRDFLSFKI